MEKGEQTYYDILGVGRDASDKDIRKAYLKGSMKFHPDKNPNDIHGKCKKRFVQIGEAYEVLSNPSKRLEYDHELKYGQNGRHKVRRRRDKEGEEEEFGNFDSYRKAFDEHVSNMSEEELNAAIGLASVVGSVIGSFVGAKLASSNNKNNRSSNSFLGFAGSMLGSAIGGQLAGECVKSVHESSIERMKDNTENSQKHKKSYHYHERSSNTNNQNSTSSSSDKWKQAFEAAVDMANSFQQSQRTKNSNNDNKKC